MFLPVGRCRYRTLATFTRWALFPYGRWTCQDGRAVLFNRWYEPIWQRLPDGTVEAADGREWVPGIDGTEHFYCREKTEAAMRQKASAALIEWGLPVPTNHDGKAYRRKKADRVPMNNDNWALTAG